MPERPNQLAINRFRREISHVRFEGDLVAVLLVNACNDHGRISDTNRALCFLSADEIERLRARVAELEDIIAGKKPLIEGGES